MYCVLCISYIFYILYCMLYVIYYMSCATHYYMLCRQVTPHPRSGRSLAMERWVFIHDLSISPSLDSADKEHFLLFVNGTKAFSSSQIVVFFFKLAGQDVLTVSIFGMWFSSFSWGGGFSISQKKVCHFFQKSCQSLFSLFGVKAILGKVNFWSKKLFFCLCAVSFYLHFLFLPVFFFSDPPTHW